VLVDMERGDTVYYVLPPPMAGFFEFSMMRLRDDIDQKALAELFHQYINVEEDFIKHLLNNGETQLGRTFVHEPVLSNENAAHVLDYERASEVIKTATHRGVGICYCRHKMEHVGKNCDAPMDICMTFNTSAEALTRHGHARAIDVAEGLDLLQKAYDHNLVQFGENAQEGVRKFAYLNPIHTTNFLPVIDRDKCTGCGKCVDVCPVEAMAMTSANDPKKPKRKVATLDAGVCLGCGVCVRNCSKDALSLTERKERVITPVNGAHKVVMMAIERGKLQNLIFDNQVLASHRALAAVLGVILKLPPIKQALASQHRFAN